MVLLYYVIYVMSIENYIIYVKILERKGGVRDAEQKRSEEMEVIMKAARLEKGSLNEEELSLINAQTLRAAGGGGGVPLSPGGLR